MATSSHTMEILYSNETNIFGIFCRADNALWQSSGNVLQWTGQKPLGTKILIKYQLEKICIFANNFKYVGGSRRKKTNTFYFLWHCTRQMTNFLWQSTTQNPIYDTEVILARYYMHFSPQFNIRWRLSTARKQACFTLPGIALHS